MNDKKRENTKEYTKLALRLGMCTIGGCSEDRSEKNKYYCEKHRIQRVEWKRRYIKERANGEKD